MIRLGDADAKATKHRVVPRVSLYATGNRFRYGPDEQVSQLYQRHSRQQRQFRIVELLLLLRGELEVGGGEMEKQMICNSVYSAAVGYRGYATLKDSTKLPYAMINTLR